GRTLRGMGAARAFRVRTPCRLQVTSGGTMINKFPFEGQRRSAAMNRKIMLTIGITTAGLAIWGGASSAQDKDTVKVPGGLAFSEFRGYEEWQVISVSMDGDLLATILGNPA